jgi:hypothetical protein
MLDTFLEEFFFFSHSTPHLKGLLVEIFAQKPTGVEAVHRQLVSILGDCTDCTGVICPHV